MNSTFSEYRAKKRSTSPLWFVIAAAILLVFALLYYLFLHRTEVKVALRDAPPGEQGVLLELSTHGAASRIELPRLRASAPLRDGRGRIRLTEEDLPPGTNRVTYVLREPWYRPDQHGVLTIVRRRVPADYVLRVAPDGEGGAVLTLTGDARNHVLLLDGTGQVLLSGRQADLADEEGAIRVAIPEENLDAWQKGAAAVSADLQVTSPTGEIDKRRVKLRESPSGAVAARVIFPPAGASTDQPIVRVRILTEPGASVAIEGEKVPLKGPEVEHDWRLGAPGVHKLRFEARAPGARPLQGTIEVKRVERGEEPAAPEAPEALEPSDTLPVTLGYATLAAAPDSHVGERVEAAGEVGSSPAPAGSSMLFELGAGEGATREEIVVVYDPDKAPPIKRGDRVIVHGVASGPHRLRTSSGWEILVPRVRAQSIELASQADDPARFRIRYARARAGFWRAPAEAVASGRAPRRDRVFASSDPWPDAPPARGEARIVSATIVSGRGDKPAEEPLPQMARARAQAPETEMPESDKAPPPRSTARSKEPAKPSETGSAATEPGATEPAPDEPATGNARVDQAAPELPAEGESEAAVEAAPPPLEQAPPRARASAWGRDPALESELAGRGVVGVKIYRKGRSLRLRGSVPTDQQLRALYQFVNNKGFGEVDYGVEVR